MEGEMEKIYASISMNVKTLALWKFIQVVNTMQYKHVGYFCANFVCDNREPWNHRG